MFGTKLCIGQKLSPIVSCRAIQRHSASLMSLIDQPLPNTTSVSDRRRATNCAGVIKGIPASADSCRVRRRRIPFIRATRSKSQVEYREDVIAAPPSRPPRPHCTSRHGLPVEEEAFGELDVLGGIDVHRLVAGHNVAYAGFGHYATSVHKF